MLLGPLLLAGCTGVFDRTRHPWPLSNDGRVRRDGALLRVYGGALTDRPAARQDALDALRRYLSGLAIPSEPEERARRIEAALQDAKFEASPSAEHGAHAVVIELDLQRLQQDLGTHYD